MVCARLPLVFSAGKGPVQVAFQEVSMKEIQITQVLVLVLCLTLAAGCLTGCKHKKQEPLATDFDGEGGDTGGPEGTSTGEGLPDLALEKLLFDPNSDSGLKPVFFDFDSSSLRPDALSALRTNADLIRQVPNVIIQIAGHCDERGTQEYNLALGERRALAVRSHLIKLGVSGDRMITISYGEEFPRALGHNEEAWAQNRRCEFNKAQSR
jgi:peptidoglycan-associated lipoprotein